MFDPDYDTPMTSDQCKASERAFLRRIGCRDMASLQKLMDQCGYDPDEVFRRIEN